MGVTGKIRLIRAIPGEVNAGFPSGVAKDKGVRALKRFHEKWTYPNIPALSFFVLFFIWPFEAFSQGIESVELEAAGEKTSVLNLFLQAGFIVKCVMAGLLLASIWSWSIIFDKWFLYTRTRRQLNRFEKMFWSGQSMESLYQSVSQKPVVGMASLFVSAMREWKRSFERGASSQIGLQTRIEKALDVSLAREAERLERRLIFLATVGSAAPFVGLFGTVIGIMTAFQAIAGLKSTSLAVVAPGIAEALMATALGLLAAIPATIFYNKLSSDVSGIILRLESFADEFSAILSRQIDERNKSQV